MIKKTNTKKESRFDGSLFTNSIGENFKRLEVAEHLFRQ